MIVATLFNTLPPPHFNRLNAIVYDIKFKAIVLIIRASLIYGLQW